jgi:hypothetical protein
MPKIPDKYDTPDNVYWLLDRIENMRTFNAVVDAITDLKLEDINDASEQEISEALERYTDPGVNTMAATMAIQRFYSRLHDLGATISMVALTHRSNAPYIPIEKLQEK